MENIIFTGLGSWFFAGVLIGFLFAYYRDINGKL